MMIERITALFLCLIAVMGISISACGQNQKNVTQADPVADPKPVAGMRMGTDYQKPGAPVRLKHDYDGSTEVSEIESITLAFVPEFDLDEVNVEIKSGSDGLVADVQGYTGAAKQGVPITIPVTVHAEEAGRYQLNMMVVSQQSGVSAARNFSLTINVGDVPREKAGVTEQIDGEPVRVMNAEEKIR